MGSKLISVLILNYNGQTHLGKIFIDCLDSVLNTCYPNFEVLFVDNASTDCSVDIVRRKFGNNQKLRIIQNEQNFGFAEGNNRGINNSKGEYIALLNNDVIVDPNWLAEITKSVESPEVGAAQSMLLQMQRPTFLDCSGGLLDFYGYHFERGRGEKFSSLKENGGIFYAKGASVLLKRKVLEKTGLFDPGIFMYFDEVDLCWRIWLSGCKVVYAPASIVYHASGSTASAMQLGSRLYFHTRNHLMVLLKNFDLKNAFTAAKVSILFETRNMILFLARRKPLISLSILRALIWNVLNLKQTWAKRQTVQRLVRIVTDQEIKQHMLTPSPPFPLYLVFSGSKHQKMQRSDD